MNQSFTSCGENLQRVFYTFLYFRDYSASATCLQSKNIPVPECSICFICTDPSMRSMVVSSWELCEQVLMGSAQKEKLPQNMAEEARSGQKRSLHFTCGSSREDSSPEAEPVGWSSGSVGALLTPPTPISIVQLYNGDNNNSGAGIYYRGILSKLKCGGC